MEISFSVPLNHFYVVVDSATYKAIEADDFLRAHFAVSEQRTTVRTDRTYTGVYFYGVDTYFEFFDVAQESGRRVGDTGVAFGVDQPGALQAIEKAPDSQFTILPQPITRQFKGAQVPWFFMAVPRNPPSSSGLSCWMMEYHPRFLEEWNPVAGGRNSGISRRQILQRYAAVLKKSHARPYLQDVVGLTMALENATATRFVELCQPLGYRSSREGDAILLDGPEVRLRLIPETDSARGIREITVRVKGKPKQTEYRFGRSALRFAEGGLAIWSV
ncbi:MAG: hypothetical protein A3F84_12900 [Candidatus Handelsmanbacteria bacterium RIFCSPLOWO2_12_FULL_64_10]|uniref:Glyoxalase-like domain-containing protein n=1 Tax=Handelsmanbacteria sp. (strain RIFCSPLOWO2_12_FULL_64_10) TaxID=1817868 RepID=A0A1F6C242_HANXR|nr:MAG: hypothetical protein A3F84_12900 [Candidatus Handelsmanbacteria bacterium RIFCSPLOWO2_12_FULL_64_10]